MKYIVPMMLLLLLSPGLSRAQDAAAVDDFQQSLLKLKQSVSQLELGNQALDAKNKELKSRLTQMQIQLGQMEMEHDVLSASAAKLSQTNQARADQIEKDVQDLAGFNDRLEKTAAQLQILQQGLVSKQAQDQQLGQQIDQMQAAIPPPPPPPVIPAAPDTRKEKLRLMKMIYESKERQGEVQGAILDYQKSQPPSAVAEAQAQQELLKSQIKQIEDDLAKQPQPAAAPSIALTDVLNEDQIRQLEDQVRDLQANYDQMQDLISKMQKKSQSIIVKGDEKKEQQKLLASTEDLTHEGRNLKGDLNDLRAQMVELDKRKSHLESMLK